LAVCCDTTFFDFIMLLRCFQCQKLSSVIVSAWSQRSLHGRPRAWTSALWKRQKL